MAIALRRSNDVVKLGSALTAGYLLGRTKRLTWALGLGLWYLSHRYRIRPGELALETAEKMLASEEFAGLRKELRSATGKRARRALYRGAEQVADMLHERTLSLQPGPNGERRPDSGRRIQKQPSPAVRSARRPASQQRTATPRQERARTNSGGRRPVRRAG